MLLLILLSCLVASATAGPPCSTEEQALLQVYSPREAIYACRALTADVTQWHSCMNSKTGLLTQGFIVSSDCWQCYGDLFAAVGTICTADTSFAECFNNSGVNGPFGSCAGFDLRTESTTCASLPSTAGDVGLAFDKASNSDIATGISDIAAVFSGTDAVYAPCEPCYQELVVQLAYAPIVDNDFATACANSGFHRTTCLAFLQPYYDLFTLCSGKTLALSVNRVAVEDRTILESGKLDVLAAKVVFGATVSPPDTLALSRLQELAGSLVVSFPSGSTCFEEYMAALAVDPSPDLAMCSNPTDPSSSCAIKDDIADLQHCLGGFTMNAVPACLSHQPLLETIYRPFGDFFACLPLFGQSGGVFDSCMDERTGFPLTGLSPSCSECYTGLITAMATTCAGWRDMDICFVLLDGSGEMGAFADCAGYELYPDRGTCGILETSNAMVRSLAKPLRESMAAVGTWPFEIIGIVANWFSVGDFAFAPCASCYARLMLDIKAVGPMSLMACETWKFASAACRVVLSEPLTRFAKCSGWELSNGGEQRCINDDLAATFEWMQSGGGHTSPDVAISAIAAAAPWLATPWDNASVDMNAVVDDWVADLSTNGPAAPACAQCFRDLVDAIVAEQPDIDACLSGGDCSMGDALGVFEICSGWHFQSSPVTEASEWNPHRCSEDEIADSATADLLYSLLVAEESVGSGSFDMDVLTTWESSQLDGSSLTCVPCFKDLVADLVAIGYYVDLQACQDTAVGCGGSVSLPFAVVKFNRCSGVKFDSGASPNYKADVTFPYPRPVVEPIDALEAGRCSLPEWNLLMARLNNIGTFTVISAGFDTGSGLREALDGTYEEYFGVPMDRQFACSRCVSSWVDSVALKLLTWSSSECSDAPSNAACRELIEAHYEATVNCAVGSTVMCSAVEGAALAAASPAFESVIPWADVTPALVYEYEPWFVSEYTLALLRDSVARDARTKGCFTCYLDRAWAMFPLLASTGDCDPTATGPACLTAKAVVESAFDACKTDRTLAAPPPSDDGPSSDESSTPMKCSVRQYQALQAAVDGLDIMSLVKAAESAAELRRAVSSAISAAAGYSVWSTRACYMCEENRAVALLSAAKDASGVCRHSFTSAACASLLASVNAERETCMKDAVDGVIPTTSTTTHVNGVGSSMSTIAAVAYIAAALAAN